MEKLESFANLPPNWDSYGADTISPSSLDAARRLLSQLDSSRFARLGALRRPFSTAPLATGGVQLEWRGPAASLEVEVDQQGASSYLMVLGEGSSRRFVEGRVDTVDNLAALVAQVTAA